MPDAHQQENLIVKLRTPFEATGSDLLKLA